MRHKRLSSERVAEILRAMADKLSYRDIMRQTKASTTVVEKVKHDFPLWSYYMKPRGSRKP